MAVIKPKKKPVVQKGEGYIYNPSTFKEHVVDNFVECDAQFILDHLQPFTTPLLPGRKFITFDTETHPHFKNSHVIPQTLCRRWVGSGKKAVPQDFPFVISICDDNYAYTVYDSLDNGFAEFKKLAPIFLDPDIEMIAHNWKFDAHHFANAGLKIVGKVHDTVVLAKIANENRPSFELRELAKWTHGGIVKFEYMVDAFKQTHHIVDYRDITRELLTQYANADVHNAKVVFLNELKKVIEDDLLGLYESEMEGMIVLYAMERYGMKIDTTYEAPLKEELQEIVTTAEQAIYDAAGYMFNINSTKQLHKALIDSGAQESWFRTTDKGNIKMDKKEIERLSASYDVPLLEKITEYRKNEKLLNTYAVGIYGQRDAEDRVHASINQTEATTGRMSITKPALQTLPKRDKRIRRAFIPHNNDYQLVFMDLDQIEYRLFAHYARAEGLLQAIRDGHDVHKATAALIFNKDIVDVGEPERDKAKTTNFALIYGQGNEHTATMLKMSMTDTIRFKDNYFNAIPEAKPFINTVHKVIKMRGFVKNFYGRRRRLKSDDAYKAPNALIQGCAADYIKTKMINIYKYMRYHKLRSMLINIVHDELVECIHKTELHHLPYIRWMLSDFDNFRCPITAGVDVGCPSWGEKEEPSFDIPFKEPEDKGYLTYNLFDGHVFNIYKEAV